MVGAQKGPAPIYGLADANIAVTGQPHSEIAALALFLHELFEGKELHKKFPHAEMEISPQARGKKVLEKKRAQKAPGK